LPNTTRKRASTAGTLSNASGRALSCEPCRLECIHLACITAQGGESICDDEEENELGAYGFRKDEPAPRSVTAKVVRKYIAAMRGTKHAQDMSNPLWNWLFRTRQDAYWAPKKLNVPRPDSPVWCFQRMGQTSTLLPDGRRIFVAGEHEDHYDPDFYIYNDVVVLSPDGEIRILGYPESDFPPTDFHTATFLEDQNSLLLIGNLSYSEYHKESTQVLKLDCETLRISKVKTSGNSPRWIHSHVAELNGDWMVVVSGGIEATETGLIENIDDWVFDPVKSHWTRLTMRKWPLARIKRKDDGHIHSFEYEMAIFNMEHQLDSSCDHHATLRKDGIEPNFDTFKELFNPSLPHVRLPESDGEYGITRIEIEGFIVRYSMKMYGIEVTFEGPISDEQQMLLTDDLCRKLAIVECAPCEIKWLRLGPGRE